MALIDRGSVMINYLENLGTKDSYKAKFEALSKAVDEAPAVDAEPVRFGRWLETGSGVVICSECGGGCNVAPMIAKRCLHCGAKMDGGAPDA